MNGDAADEHRELTNPPSWHTYGERSLYDNPWVQLVQVDVEPPGSERFWHHVIRLRPVAAAIVVDEQDRVLMLHRHRFAVDQVGWELPGGILSDDEDSATTARRETEEETGWRPTGKPELLASFQPMPGMVSAQHDVFLFESAEQIGEPTDHEEAGTVAWLPLADMPELLHTGQLLGACTQVGLMYLLARRGLSAPEIGS